MCYLFRLLVLLAWLGNASAVTPPPDKSAGLFAGEWAGTGERGSYCYLKLSVDGSGGVLVDGGSGDWLGARIQWRNQQQSLLVERVIPWPAAPQQRIMPLEKLVISGGFNQSLKLTWNELSAGCQLQRVESTARRLDGARKAIDLLLPGESRR
jgi:hypothetical protein